MIILLALLHLGLWKFLHLVSSLTIYISGLWRVEPRRQYTVRWRRRLQNTTAGLDPSILLVCLFFMQKRQVLVYYFWVIAPVVLIHSACGFDIKMIVLLILKTLLTVMQVLLRLQGKGTATPSRECGGCQEAVGHFWRTHWAWEELDRAQLLKITMIRKYSKYLSC